MNPINHNAMCFAGQITALFKRLKLPKDTGSIHF